MECPKFIVPHTIPIYKPYKLDCKLKTKEAEQMENQEIKELNFKEIESVEDANRVNMTVYSFVKFSECRNCYIFKKRVRK